MNVIMIILQRPAAKPSPISSQNGWRDPGLEEGKVSESGCEEWVLLRRWLVWNVTGRVFILQGSNLTQESALLAFSPCLSHVGQTLTFWSAYMLFGTEGFWVRRPPPHTSYHQIWLTENKKKNLIVFPSLLWILYFSNCMYLSYGGLNENVHH